MSAFSWLRQRAESVTGGVDTFPLLMLTTLFFFDEFDTAAFNVLAPNIRNAFGLSFTEFGLLVVANLTIVLLAAVPMGHYGDRLPRRKFVVAGAILAGICSFFTGLVSVLGLLVIVRLGNGIGRLVNDPIHSSLLADYYKPEDRPGIFGFHRNAVYLGTIVGSALAGLMTWAFGTYKAAFLVLIVPIVAAALYATRLKEPVRGATDDPEAAESAEKEEPVPFNEATRTLFAVKTLRRQFAAWLFIGAGLVPLAWLLPLTFERVFHLGALERGLIGAVNAAATFAGIRVSSKRTIKWLAEGMGEPLKRAGIALSLVGVGIATLAFLPLALFVPVGIVTSFVAGIFFPPFYTTQAFVSPARVRSLSYSFGSLFIVAGVWLLYFLPGISAVADNDGMRWGLFATFPFWIIGGLILRSGHRFVATDTERAMANLAIVAEMRRARREVGEETLLVCRGVAVAYDQVQVLFGVDMEVRSGEIVALLGTNGAGKSTLLKAISGVVDPIGGAMFFGGRDITHADANQTAKLGIVQVPGGRAVFPTLTVAEHLRAAGWLYRDDPKYLDQANEEVLDTFPRLRERIDQMAGNLSGGEQQMLGLAMAFIAKPRLLMIDELSLGLAPTIVEQLLEIVRKIRDQGTAIILVEQSINVALTVAERAYFMEKGEVRFKGDTAELLERDDIVRSVFLEGAVQETGQRPTRRSGSRSSSSNGDEFATAGIALETAGLTKRFGGVRAVDDCDIVLREGEILGLIGPNGAGKTTIFDLISGFLIPDSGKIELGGEDITAMPPHKRAWRGLGRSFQDARLASSLTVAENIAIGLERHLEVRDHIASAMGLPGVRRLEEDVAWTVADLIELMNLGAYRDKFVRELSTGTRRIVDLAMAIAHDPRVLLLDEPSSGIAQREAEALGPLLERIRRETGCALLVIEHDMPLIKAVSNRIVALELGHPIAEGSPDEVTRDPRVVTSYLGGDMAAINRSGKTKARAR